MYLSPRYFDCKPLHGLFAPVHKVSRAGASASSTPSPHSRPLMTTSLRSSRERSGSQESVSSISSTASSVSRSRVRLGVTSLANQVHAAFLIQSLLDVVHNFSPINYKCYLGNDAFITLFS